MTQTQALNEKGRDARRRRPAHSLPQAATTSGVLDWQAFTDAYFPRRGRHDLEALVAYGAYRRSRTIDQSPSDDADPLAGAENDAVEAPALRVWESEGGAIP